LIDNKKKLLSLDRTLDKVLTSVATHAINHSINRLTSNNEPTQDSKHKGIIKGNTKDKDRWNWLK